MPGAALPGQMEPEPIPADPNEPPPKPDPRYEELPLTEKAEKTFKKQINDINRILSAGRFAENQQQLFDKFFEEYALARWTQQRNLNNLTSYRQELRAQFRRAKSGQVFEHLNALALKFFSKLAAGNYHPAVRVNAMLAIGELNRVEQTSIDTPPIPLPDALKVLIAALNDAKMPDAVRAAAMVGIFRHVLSGNLDEESRRSLTAGLLRLVADDLPDGPARAGREWILAQAFETLGLLQGTIDGHAVYQALLAGAANTKLSLSTRAVAVRALGFLDSAQLGNVNVLQAATTLAEFLAEGCKEVAAAAKNNEQAADQRRRIKYFLEATITALKGAEGRSRTGLAALARDGNQQSLINELHQNLKELSDWLEDKQTEEKSMAPKVAELQEKLAAWLSKAKSDKA